MKRHAPVIEPRPHVTGSVILDLERVAIATRATNAAVEEQLRLIREEETQDAQK
jgi:hypothetical protein